MNCAIVTSTTSTTQQLQDHVDACLDQLSDEWTASFVFAMAPFNPCNNEVASFDIKTNLQPCDISKFLGGQRPEYTRLYFCPDTYPPNPSYSPPPAAGTLPIIQHNQPNGGSVPDSGGTPNNDPPSSFLALKKDLESEAFTQCKFGLMSNGGASRQAKNQFRRFVCRDAQNRANSKYSTSRKTTIQSAKVANLLRSSKLINNRSGDRKDGKSKPRRTTTNFGHHSCTFCFTVRWDSIGLYISLEKSGGCATHRFHIRSTSSSLPTRLLGANERETLGHLAASCCTTGVGQSYLLAKVGRYMSNSKVAYIYDQAASIRHGDEGTPEMSDYDHLTRYFEQTRDIAYTVLWDVCSINPAAESTAGDAPAAVSTPAASTTGCGHQGSPSSFLMSHTKFDNQNSCTKDHSNDPSMIGLRTEGQMCRANYKLSADTKVFLAIAWVFKPELRYHPPYTIHTWSHHCLRQAFSTLSPKKDKVP
jgi:hypothetical protein